MDLNTQPEPFDAGRLELDELARQLARLQPVAQGTNRDRLMFAAGQASVRLGTQATSLAVSSTLPNGRLTRWMKLWSVAATVVGIFLGAGWWQSHGELTALRADGSPNAIAPGVANQQAAMAVDTEQRERRVSPSESRSIGQVVDDQQAHPLAWLQLAQFFTTGLGDSSQGISTGDRSMVELRNELLARSWQRTWPVSRHRLLRSNDQSNAQTEEPATAGQRLRLNSAGNTLLWFDRESSL